MSAPRRAAAGGPRWLAGLLCLGLAGAPVLGQPIVLIDAAGRSVRLPGPATRIVSLAPHVTELLYAAGAGERLVAAVDYSDYPPAAGRLPRVGDFRKLDLEAILGLGPDLAIGWLSGNPRAELERLEGLGVRLFLTEPRTLEDIGTTLRELGRLAGTGATAEPAARDFDARLRALQAEAHGAAPVRVFYQIWDRPLITVNGEHLISDVIRRCGGRNVFADLPGLAPRIDVESVLRADPQAIIASGADEQRPPWLDAWRAWPELSAVRGAHLYFVAPQLIQRHTPRILEGMRRLCAQLARVRAASSG